MASAKQITRVVPVEKVTVAYDVAPDGAELKLTHREAQALAHALSCVGGDPRTTARRHIDAISTALQAAGYLYTDILDEVEQATGLQRYSPEGRLSTG